MPRALDCYPNQHATHNLDHNCYTGVVTGDSCMKIHSIPVQQVHQLMGSFSLSYPKHPTLLVQPLIIIYKAVGV